jgi:hypothetical protein
MLFKNKGSDPSMLVYACNPNTQEAEAGRLRVWGQCGLYSKTQKKKKKKVQVWEKEIGGSLLETSQGKKVSETPSQPTIWAWWHAPVVPSYSE